MNRNGPSLKIGLSRPSKTPGQEFRVLLNLAQHFRRPVANNGTRIVMFSVAGTHLQKYNQEKQSETWLQHEKQWYWFIVKVKFTLCVCVLVCVDRNNYQTFYHMSRCFSVLALSMFKCHKHMLLLPADSLLQIAKYLHVCAIEKATRLLFADSVTLLRSSSCLLNASMKVSSFLQGIGIQNTSTLHCVRGNYSASVNVKVSSKPLADVNLGTAEPETGENIVLT